MTLLAVVLLYSCLNGGEFEVLSMVMDNGPLTD